MSALHVGYVAGMFPQLSETFVTNEILGFQQLGIQLRVYSYRRPTASVPRECLRRIEAPITYLAAPLGRHPGTLLRAIVAALRRDRARTFQTISYVLEHSVLERNPNTWRRFLHAAQLAHLASEAGIEHLHAHLANGATRISMLASMLTGLPFSFSAHARDIYTADVPLLREKLEAAEYVLTCTRANKKYLQQLVEPAIRSKILLRYHGVDLSKFTPRNGAPNDGNKTPVILSVGRLVEKKGFPDLLSACSILKKRGIQFRCLIVGEGPERGQLAAMVKRMGLDDVVSMPGSRSQEELLGIYHSATLFALPCRVLQNGDRDGIPNVLLEAMATGLPVVSSHASAVREFIDDGHNGLLVTERDDDSLAAALERLIRDEQLRERIAHNGRATVQQRFDAVVNNMHIASLFGADVAEDAGRDAPRYALS